MEYDIKKDYQQNRKAVGILIGICIYAFINALFVNGVFGYVVENNAVYINDSNIFLQAEPHTINQGLHWVYFNTTSKIYEGNVRVLVGFDTETVNPIRAEYYNKHDIFDGNETVTRYFTEISDFDSQYYFHGGMNKWFWIEKDVLQNQDYQIRILINVTQKVKAKYWFCVMPASETIAEAISNGHFYCLDPWLDFTGFTEVDASGVLEILSSNRIWFHGLPRNANNYIYRDVGIYTNFTLNITVRINQSNAAQYFAGMGDQINNFQTISNTSGVYIYDDGSTSKVYLWEGESGVPNNIFVRDITDDEEYYIIVEKLGTNVTLHLYHQNGTLAGYNTLSTAWAEYRYVYAVSGNNDAAAQASNGEVTNMSLLPTSVTINVTINAPQNNTNTTNNSVQIQYTPIVQSEAISGACVWTNKTGSFAEDTCNSTAVTNNSLNTITVGGLPIGQIVFNVNVSSTTANNFSEANFTLNVSPYMFNWTSPTQANTTNMPENQTYIFWNCTANDPTDYMVIEVNGTNRSTTMVDTYSGYHNYTGISLNQTLCAYCMGNTTAGVWNTSQYRCLGTNISAFSPPSLPLELFYDMDICCGNPTNITCSGNNTLRHEQFLRRCIGNASAETCMWYNDTHDVYCPYGCDNQLMRCIDPPFTRNILVGVALGIIIIFAMVVYGKRR